MGSCEPCHLWRRDPCRFVPKRQHDARKSGICGLSGAHAYPEGLTHDRHLHTRPDRVRRPAGARGGRGPQPRPAPVHGQGVDAARVRAVEPWPRLRRSCPGSPAQSSLSDDRADGLRGQPAHRGQPAELPPRDRLGLRPRRRLGHLGAPLDRRGGPARARHARLPAGHPRRRPGRARAGPDATGRKGLRQRQQRRPARGHRVRHLPGARDPDQPPQHRPSHARTRSPSGCWPGSPPTRTCT